MPVVLGRFVDGELCGRETTARVVNRQQDAPIALVVDLGHEAPAAIAAASAAIAVHSAEVRPDGTGHIGKTFKPKPPAPLCPLPGV